MNLNKSNLLSSLFVCAALLPSAAFADFDLKFSCVFETIPLNSPLIPRKAEIQLDQAQGTARVTDEIVRGTYSDWHHIPSYVDRDASISIRYILSPESWRMRKAGTYVTESTIRYLYRIDSESGKVRLKVFLRKGQSSEYGSRRV